MALLTAASVAFLGAGTAAPEPSPSSTTLPSPLATLEGGLAKVIVGACKQLERLNRINCENEYILHSEVLIFDDGGDYYTVIFRHEPLRGIDDSIGVSVPKRP
jgi:hypothetical protein